MKLLLCSILFLSLIPLNNFATAQTPVNVTLGELEDIVINHLETNELNYHLSTDKYVDYLMSLLIEDADKELARHPSYDLILYYAAEYLYELENLQVESLTNPEAKEEEFDLGEKLEMTVSEVKAEIAVENKQLEMNNHQFKPMLETNSEIGTMDLGGSGWNGTAAANYAKKYYNTRNSEYNQHSLNCTNFVSQAVFAGGGIERRPSPRPNGINETTSHWYSDRTYDCVGSNSCRYFYHESTSWIRVVDFHSYWKGRGMGVTTSFSKSTIVSNSLVGDVIQLQRSSDGRWYHSMIVNRKANGTVYLAGNTNNTYDKPLTDITAQSFRVIKFR